MSLPLALVPSVGRREPGGTVGSELCGMASVTSLPQKPHHLFPCLLLELLFWAPDLSWPEAKDLSAVASLQNLNFPSS